MGAVQSNSITQLAQTVNSVVNQSVNQTANITTQDCVSTQNLTINICLEQYCGSPAPTGCVADNNVITNSGNQSCSLNSSAISQLSANLQANLSSAVSQAVQQSEDLVTGWLSTTAAFQQQGITTSADVANHLSNIVENISYSDAVNTMLSNQAQVINICGSFINNNVSNNVQQNALVSNVTNLVMNSLSNDSVYNSLSQYAQQQTTGKFAGLSLGGWIGIIAGACIFFLLVGGIWYYKRRHRTMGSTPRVPSKEIEMKPMGASAVAAPKTS
jgi:hypothetical protein